MIVQICVGSSCHLKGAEQIVSLFQKAIEERNLDDDIILAGSFCTGNCNREGVTIHADDETFTGITPETFGQFLQTQIIPRL